MLRTFAVTSQPGLIVDLIRLSNPPPHSLQRTRTACCGLLEVWRIAVDSPQPIATSTEDNAVTRAVSSGGETAHPAAAQRLSVSFSFSRG